MKKKRLVGQFFPAFKEFGAEFLKNPVVGGWTGRLRVYSTLFDT